MSMFNAGMEWMVEQNVVGPRTTSGVSVCFGTVSTTKICQAFYSMYWVLFFMPSALIKLSSNEKKSQIKTGYLLQKHYITIDILEERKCK